jgi:hypothetical protein
MERTTVKRSIYPQGHLTGLCRILKQKGIDLERFVHTVDVNDPWFQHRKVNVISRADFEKDAIQSIHARLKYGSEQKDILLESSDDRKTVEWNSIVEKDILQRDVKVSYKVTFKKTHGVQRPSFVESGYKILNVDNWEVDPRVLYSFLTIPIYTFNFPWQRYPRVEVHVAYSDSDSDSDSEIALQHENIIVLDQEHPQGSWEVLQSDSQIKSIKYQIRYKATDYQERVAPWVECEEPQIMVVDPLPCKEAKVTVLAQFDWAETELVTVDVAYLDAENNIEVHQSLIFVESDKIPKTFMFHPATSTVQKPIEYITTVVFKDGRLIEIPKSVTNRPLIIISPESKGHRIVNVQPEPMPFSTKKLERVKLELSYDDDENNLHHGQKFSFTASDNSAVFEFDYINSQNNRYRYRAAYLYENGLTQTTDWIETDKAKLVVPLQ